MPLRKTTRLDTGVSLACPCGKAFPSFRSMGAHSKWCDLATPEVRFWHMVEKRGPDECWGWKAQKRWDGYGRFFWEGVPLWSHRYSYLLHYGEIAAGMHVLHACHNPECTNPKHLRLGTHQENMREMQQAGRGNQTLSHDQVREARKLLEAMPATEIAEKFGVKPCVIYALKAGRNYKHVEPIPHATPRAG